MRVWHPEYELCIVAIGKCHVISRGISRGISDSRPDARQALRHKVVAYIDIIYIYIYISHGPSTDMHIHTSVDVVPHH